MSRRRSLRAGWPLGAYRSPFLDRVLFPCAGVAMPAIRFFPNAVRGKIELRPNRSAQERQAGGMVTRNRWPSFRVNDSNFVGGWSSQGSANPTDNANRLPGEVLKRLLTRHALPDQDRDSELAGQESPKTENNIKNGADFRGSVQILRRAKSPVGGLEIRIPWFPLRLVRGCVVEIRRKELELCLNT